MLKKIETKEGKKTREKKKMIIGIIIGIILVASSIAFTVLQSYESTEEQKYNNYAFIKQESMWQTRAGDTIIKTNFLPQDVENVTAKTPYISRDDFSNKIVYFVAKITEEKQAGYELSQYISPERMQYACLPDDNGTECLELPGKSCEDVTENTAIIIIQDTSRTTNETKISYNQGCLEIEGNQDTLIKATEKAIFIMFGIIG